MGYLILPRRSGQHPTHVLPFHNMASYELSGGSINLAILYKLEVHIEEAGVFSRYYYEERGWSLES